MTNDRDVCFLLFLIVTTVLLRATQERFRRTRSYYLVAAIAINKYTVLIQPPRGFFLLEV